MANVYLGPLGAETLLPVLRFIGSAPSLTVETGKQIERGTMSDGSRRWAFFPIRRTWPLVLGYLSLAQLNILRNLNALNQTLRYQNNNVDATWYNVVITSFSWEPERSDIPNLGRYKCDITLEQA